MSALASPATWRTRPYHSTGHLWIYKPSAVYSAQVNQTLFTYPLAEVTYDSGSGTLASVETGMMIVFGSSAGASDLGRTYVRKTPTATTFYIGRVSQGVGDNAVNLANDMYITVLDVFLPWPKNDNWDTDGTFYFDHDIDFATYGANSLPVANAGPYYAQKVDGSNQITVDFDGSNSFPTAPGASISSYAWTFPGATPPSAATATVSNVVFGAGARWVKLVVTDNNAQSHTARALVVGADDSSNKAFKAEVDGGDRLTVDTHEISFRINEAISQSDYPIGTVVIFWEDEYYGSSAGSLAGVADREHVKFVGYVVEIETRSETTPTHLRHETTVRCVNVAARMKQMICAGFDMEHVTSPAAWQQMNNPTIDRFQHLLLQWNSTVLSIADWIWSGTGTSYLLPPDYGIEENNLYAMVDELSKRITHRLTCDNVGRILVKADPILQDAAGGATTVARTTTEMIALTQSDLEAIEGLMELLPKQYQLEASADLADNSAQYKAYCLAPGHERAYGDSRTEESNYLAASQAELNAWIGHLWARNNPKYSLFTLRLSKDGDAGIYPGLMEWVDLTLSATYAAERGISFTNARLLVHEISIDRDHEHGTKRQSLVVEVETTGLDAVTLDPPQEGETAPNIPANPDFGDFGTWPDTPWRDEGYDDLPDQGGNTPPSQPDPTNPDDELPPYPVPPGSGSSTPANPALPLNDQTCVIWTTSILRLTKNFGSSSPNWKDVTPDLDAGYEIKQFVWSGFGTDGYLLASDGTSSKVWYCGDLSAGTPSWTDRSGEITGVFTLIDTTGSRNQLYIYAPAGNAWTHTFQFDTASGSDPDTTYDQGGWALTSNPYAGTGTCGRFTSGTGWQENSSSYIGGGNVYFKACNAEKSFDESVITSVSLVFDTTIGDISAGNSGYTIDLYSGGIGGSQVAVESTQPSSSGTDITLTWEGEVTCDLVHFDLRAGVKVGSDPGGTLTAKYLTMSGIGPNPFAATLKAATRYSTDGGATWSSESTIGDTPGADTGFDVASTTTNVIASTDTQPRKASGGGVFSDYGTTLPALSVPNCIHVPRAQIGTDSDSNANSTPDYLLASDTASGGENVWKVTASGATFTGITPNDGSSDGAAISPNCVWMPWRSGKIIATILDYGGTRKLAVSENGGTTWTFRASLGATGDYIRTPKANKNSLFWIDGAAYYSPDLGVKVYKKATPESGYIGIAPYG